MLLCSLQKVRRRLLHQDRLQDRQEAQKAALCARVTSLRAQLVHIVLRGKMCCLLIAPAMLKCLASSR